MSGVISGSTKIFGVIGDPIWHTFSPLMFNAAFSELGLDCIYVPFHVEKRLLRKAIDGMRALNIAGLNVTIPHKVDVMKYLDEIDGEARLIGAVNTIVNDKGILKGYNTDGQGFLHALAKEKVAISGRRIVILGAGGASRAITSALAGFDVEIIVLNRTTNRAKDLAAAAGRKSKMKIKALELNPDNLAATMARAHILVNTTSVGMAPDIDISPVPSGLLKPALTVVDIVYNPSQTRLLTEAAKAGCRTLGGIHMLVAQGALSFEKWTGFKAPVEIMTHVAIGQLQQ